METGKGNYVKINPPLNPSQTLTGIGQGTMPDFDWYKKNVAPAPAVAHPCPSCGHCPTCGRGGQMLPSHYGPYRHTGPYEVPYISWTMPGVVCCNGSASGSR